MSMTLNERNPNILSINLGTQAASINLPAAYMRKHARIKEVRLLNQAGISADNTNYLQLSLQDSSSNVYATYDTRAANQGAVTANQGAKFILSSPDLTYNAPSTPAAQQEADVPSQSHLILALTVAGTASLTKALLQIEYYPL